MGQLMQEKVSLKKIYLYTSSQNSNLQYGEVDSLKLFSFLNFLFSGGGRGVGG